MKMYEVNDKGDWIWDTKERGNKYLNLLSSD
jgi:hypothetical protein